MGIIRGASSLEKILKKYIRGKEINFSKTLAASMPIKLLPQTKFFTFGNYSTILIILMIYFPISHAT